MCYSESGTEVKPVLVLISLVCVYIAQRLQHASATLPGSATQPQFSLTGSHMLTSARHFLLFPLTKSLSQRKSAFCLYLVNLIGQSCSLNDCHRSSHK